MKWDQDISLTICFTFLVLAKVCSMDCVRCTRHCIPKEGVQWPVPFAVWRIGWKRKFIFHDDIIKWKHFPRYWPFVWGIHLSPVNSLHKSQWRGSLMFSLICALINGWVNSHEAGDLRRNHAHYDVILMSCLLNQHVETHDLDHIF